MAEEQASSAGAAQGGRGGKNEDGVGAAQRDDLDVKVAEGVMLYYYVALGGVYESAGLQELALACFCEGQLVGDKLSSRAPESALRFLRI